MSFERPVSLNTSLDSSSSFGMKGQSERRGANEDADGEGRHSPNKLPPAPGAKDRFHQAMTDVRTNAEISDDRPSSVRAESTSPFELFGAAAMSRASQPSTAPDPGLNELLHQQLERLMVEHGHNDDRQVRMDLKSMPGVTVVIREAEGRLQVDFICVDDAARLRLNTQAREHAQTLARRLNREVMIRVQTDDEEWPCLEEVSAQPEGDTGTKRSL
jgi:hypothetical protein